MNYFELFDLPLAPTVDKSKISKKYFELQKKYHPDFFSGADDETKEDGMLMSAMVNKAYKTFQNPDKTIEYFLQESGLIQTDEKYELPQEFLMEMMEMNESLSENKESSEQEIADLERRLWNDVKPLLQYYSSGVTTGEELQRLKLFYYKKKVYKPDFGQVS